jgi:hypothetical protein
VENSYSVIMALMDYIPVLGFMIGAFFLSKIFFGGHKQQLGWMVLIGGVLIFMGGALQATWKLFMALNVGNFSWMSQGQFIFMAFGYSALLIPAISLISTSKLVKNAPLPAMAVWKIPFLAVMTLASIGTYGILTFVAFRRRQPLAALGFIMALLGVLLLGGMASQEQTIAMQWIEQSVNSLANLGFALGSFLLSKNFSQNSNARLTGLDK